jgi:DNA polymerase
MAIHRFPGASPWVPSPDELAHSSLASLHEAASACRGCDLWRGATQVVFGDGPESARIMLVGEQPGDQEDRRGLPFVGPAGRLLDRILVMAGINRSETYVTNAVKHFKWQPRGSRRIHQKPTLPEVRACRPWLAVEIARVHPQVLVALGATAAQALLGATIRVTEQRGELLPSEWEIPVLVTIHPSAILRIPDEAGRNEAIERMADDLRQAARSLPRAA